MEMFALSGKTAAELQRLIDDRGGSTVGGSSAAPTRQLAFVRCITWDTGTSQGTCVVTEYNASTASWTDFGTSSNTLLLSAQATALEAGKRYLAVRYGNTGSGLVVFVAFPSANVPYYYAGCGVTIDSSSSGNRIRVDLGNIKGQGLKVFSGTPCPTIGIDPACGITLLGGDKVGVQNSDLAGNGLVPGAGCSLDVNPGCGIQVVGDAVSVKRSDLIGDGLYPGAGTCALAVYPGCGVKLDAGKVAVDLDNIKGQGLKIFPGTGGACPKVGIDPGCHISLEGGEKVGVLAGSLAGCGLTTEAVGGCERLRVNTTPAGGYFFSAITAVSLMPQAYGCGLTLAVAVTPFELLTNSCGVVIGFDAGTPFISTSDVSIDVTKCGNLCDFCVGYGTYGNPGTPGTPGNCWDGTKWVACVTAPVLAMMLPPTF